jgi:tetratricopeptide (TPR) repeat protein
VSVLGEGGFGKVWLAEQVEPIQRRVALKILKLGMDTLEVMARFERERQTLALMDHPNIARVLDAGASAEGRPYFVMELVEGVALTRYCLEKAVPLEGRLRLMQGVCAGVQHAHLKGIIHRDLKPSNVLVTEVDGVAVPKIIDFGIAKATTTDRVNELLMVTRFGHLMGTPIYMSPEQADASGDIDTRSDVYALGALMYEVVAGRPPFDAETLQLAGEGEMRRIIREVEPVAPSRWTEGGRGAGEEKGEVTLNWRLERSRARDLDLITLRALEKDRERRYQSASQMGEDIERFLNREAIVARAPSAGYVMRRWVRRHWVMSLGVGSCAAALVLGGMATYWQKRKAEAALGMMASVLSETDTISYVRLQKMRDVLALAARQMEGLSEVERLRLHTGIGKAYWGLREWETAVDHLAKAVEIAKKVKVAPRAIQELLELRVLCLLGGGRGEEAVVLVEKMLPVYEAELLPDDPAKLFLATVHAKALRAAGRPKESVAAFEALFARLKTWPSEPDPVDVVNAHLSYPIALRQAGEGERALVEARQNIRMAKRMLGAVDLHHARALVLAANECREAGLEEEAHGYLDLGWRFYADDLGALHHSTQEAKEDLVALKKELGKVEEAVQVQRDTVSLCEEEVGDVGEETLYEREILVRVLKEAGRDAEAREVAEASVAALDGHDGGGASGRREWVRKFRGYLEPATGSER